MRYQINIYHQLAIKNIFFYTIADVIEGSHINIYHQLAVKYGNIFFAQTLMLPNILPQRSISISITIGHNFSLKGVRKFVLTYSVVRSLTYFLYYGKYGT